MFLRMRTMVVARLCVFQTLIAASWGIGLLAQTAKPVAEHNANTFPWMNVALSPDQRADLVTKAMTLDEKLQMVAGAGYRHLDRPNPGAGFVEGIPRLGIPEMNLADAAVGVRMDAKEGRYATLMPSTLGSAASWDPQGAFLYGAVIGKELREQGFTMSLGGGVNLMREPRSGRNFEYAGEDPVLAGTMTGNLMNGVASAQIMTDIKHYAMNDQESGRQVVNAVIGKKAMRESDLLAFQIAIGISHPSAVMCAYNLVNGQYACENPYLLNEVLKKDLNFKGFVLSDWGATHSTVEAALAGLDQDMLGKDGFYSEKLKQAIQDGRVSLERLEEMDHRILRSMFAAGVMDHPQVKETVDPFAGRAAAQRIAEESIVLLRNEDRILPLHSADGNRLVLIGSHADVGVLSGGGSAQVNPPGGNAVKPIPGVKDYGITYFPSSPLKCIQAQAPSWNVSFNSGSDLASAAADARAATVAIVFANQPTHEAKDVPTLSLPYEQDALIETVAKANPNTIVVLETGGPVSMPWLHQVKGVLEAWYPGIGGAQALANILFGSVNPSAKLPATFPVSEAQLPRPAIFGDGVDHGLHAAHFDVNYTDGARIGYKWYESEKKEPLFPFGFGLSYTSFTLTGLSVDNKYATVHFTMKNTGAREGVEIAEVYAALPEAAKENYKRLVGWQRVKLAPGESKTVEVKLDPLYLSIFDEQNDAFVLLPGEYKILLGSSVNDIAQTTVYRVQ